MNTIRHDAMPSAGWLTCGVAHLARLPIVLLLVSLSACGGGGSGGSGGGGGSPSASVQFTGFSFQIGNAPPFSTPPTENLALNPPKLGAPMDLVVIFNFDGVPQGPFNQQNLPVYTTDLLINQQAGAFPGQGQIPAKGSYVGVGQTVQFRPFIPTNPLSLKLSNNPPDSVPGLIPDSTYIAKVVSAVGQKIPNLKGSGGTVEFMTTEVPAGYFSGGAAGKFPVLVSSIPVDGATGFHPSTYSDAALGSPFPSFPDGPRTVQLVFDQQLLPVKETLEGKDWNKDGLLDANFFFRTQGTRILVSQQVPAGSAIGTAEAFPAVSGLDAGMTVPLDGSAIFLHDSQGFGALPGAQAGILSAPASMATGFDPSLLFVVLEVEGGPDLLSVVDHVLGDPSAARIAPSPLSTGLDRLVGLTTLIDGRLVGWDAGTRRIHELRPQVTRELPVGTPQIMAIELGDGTSDGGFLSDAWPPGPEVLDLAQAPSGDLYALVSEGGPFPVLRRLNMIDPSLGGNFASGEGLPAASDVAFSFSAAVAALKFVSETRFFALDRESDSIVEFDLLLGELGPVVSGVGAYGVPLASLPDELSPARDFEIGQLDLDVTMAILANDVGGAVVELTPRGVLPFGATIDVMARPNLPSLSGNTKANANPGAPLYVLGAERLLTVGTSSASSTLASCGVPDPDGRVNDAYVENFDDKQWEDPTAQSVNPLADWAKPGPLGTSSGYLRASATGGGGLPLGDFIPTALPNFNLSAAQTHSIEVAGFNAGIDLVAAANYRFVFLDTDNQILPLPDGATPGVTQFTVVQGGHFVFRDFIIPVGVNVVVRGSNPLRITATGRVEIAGVLDISGDDAGDDSTFDSGFFPVPGGSGGPGGGRGGDGHPTVLSPNAPTTAASQYATPETGERGFGPVLTPTGAILFAQVGGHGGLSTAGYDPYLGGYPFVHNTLNNYEGSRPPGGGGGSFYFPGRTSREGTGSYRVQSSSSWGNFTLCPTNDKINDSLYGNEEGVHCPVSGLPTAPIQCVYMQGTPSDPVLFQPGALPGDGLFPDGSPANDYIGPDGELTVLLGGQGGGGGGSRIDSISHAVWAGTGNVLALPAVSPPSPVCYPLLWGGGTLYFSPTRWDSKGGAGGGGAGSVLIRTFGDIVVRRTGVIDASGGRGGGGEINGASEYVGGGGGGSGGAIILQAAGEIRIEADANHVTPGYADLSGARGASLEVSGGPGHDAKTDAKDNPFANKPPFDHQYTRSDGGQGGFGLIQLQSGAASGLPIVQQGAFLFAKQRCTLKQGSWTGDPGKQLEHPTWAGAGQNKPPDALRYIDILEYRYFTYDTGMMPGEPSFPTWDRWLVLNGSDPPIITVTNPGVLGPFQLDTPMIDYFGRRVVKEPQPEKIMKTYNGWNASFIEINTPSGVPGTLYSPSDILPFSVTLKEPDGTPIFVNIDGQVQVDPAQLVDRLPVVAPGKAPPPLGTVSRGTSKWLDFNGVMLQMRDGSGLAPPFFPGMNGTYNELLGVIPPGQSGQVVTGGAVPGVPASFVAKTGIPPFDPGLCGLGSPPNPPFNDVKVDLPEFALENAISSNATVTVHFQGAWPVRAGSSVADASTLTSWVADLRALSGFPLVRYQVSFNLGKDVANFPLGADSLRPAVDQLRVRARY